MPKVTDEHRAARRLEILEAGIRCVVREGFHKTTMAAVIAESGLSAGAVYGYFKGKPELIRAIAETAVGGVVDILREAARGPEPVQIHEVFASLVEAVASRHEEHGMGVVAVHAWSEAARDPQVREVSRARVAELHQCWVEVLDRAESDGTLEPGRDKGAMARIMVGLMPGFIVQGPLLGEIDVATYVRGFEAITRRSGS